MVCQLIEIDIELEKEYKQFLETDKGKEWKEDWKKRCNPNDINNAGDFGDYLYDFYTEMLM